MRYRAKKRLVLLMLTFLMAVLVPTASVTTETPCKFGGTPYRDCPACGEAQSIKTQQENVLKNRDESAENAQPLSVADIRDPKNDNNFYPNMAVEVTGYVAKVSSGGFSESCNCKRTDLRDLQINIVASRDEIGKENRYVVLEISPRWEKTLGLDDSDYPRMLAKLKSQIERKQVVFRGWMFYDAVHVDQSESTNPGNPSNWRATPWELHPVTYYQVKP